MTISVLSKLLYHWRLQPVARAWTRLAARPWFGVTGPAATSAAANIFVGTVGG